MLKRALIAFTVTALLCASTYTYALLAEYQQRVGVPISSPGSLFGIVVFFALLTVLLLGLPTLLLFEKCHWRKAWMYMAAGGALGSLVINDWFGPSLPFVGVGIGVIGGLTFWSILRPDRSNSRLDADASRRST